MKRFECKEGHELRGFRIRLYPTADDLLKLDTIQAEERLVWNWLVSRNEDAKEAGAAYAVRNGLVGARPVRPVYDGMLPSEAEKAAAEYRAACAEWRRQVGQKTKGVAECKPPSVKQWAEHFGKSHDYQFMQSMVKEKRGECISGSHVFQALTKAFYSKSKGWKRFRKKSDPMPVQVRTGDCFELGSFGERRGTPFYNCRVKINGMKIRGRLPGRIPGGRVIEGVSLVKEADGWWASVKVEVPIAERAPAVPGTVAGIDVGLLNLAAIVSNTGEEKIVVNTRGAEYAERIAGRRAMKKPTAMLECRAARHIRHLIHNEIVLPLDGIETIKLEKLPPFIGQMGSRKTSAMRMVYNALKARHGDRVREVDPCFTSQDCSQCGFRSKETWSYEHGRVGKCPACGHSEDRDLNAARNIAARDPEPLAAE